MLLSAASCNRARAHAQGTLGVRCPSRCQQGDAKAPLVEHLGEGLPEHHEERSLDAVRQDPRAQPPAPEAYDAFLVDDGPSSLRVADGRQRCLPHNLQHADRVGGHVRGDSCGKPYERIPDVLSKPEVELRQRVAELVVSEKERVMPHRGSRENAHSPMPEGTGVSPRLLDQPLEPVLPPHLLCRLPRVKGQDDQSEDSSGGRGEGGLDRDGHVPVLQARKRELIGGSVAEA
mmetsp:Transcript_140702/g.392159  ORF Transcript_140702/g.392159 Transcript_140702/m.392159 type:complete len:232 (+) Transcript_140702:97-792(+)